MRTRSRIVCVFTPSHSGADQSTLHHTRITLPAEPWHVDEPEATHPRPSERSLYALHAPFGCSGSRNIAAPVAGQKTGGGT